MIHILKKLKEQNKKKKVNQTLREEDSIEFDISSKSCRTIPTRVIVIKVEPPASADSAAHKQTKASFSGSPKLSSLSSNEAVNLSSLFSLQ